MIKKFKFLCKPEVIYGENSISFLPSAIKSLKIQKLLLVVDRNFSKTIFFEEIKNNLKKESIEFFVFDKVEGEPSTEIGDECADFGKGKKCDGVCGIGGGSTLDTAKASSVLITNPGKVRDYQGLNKVPGPGLPKIMIPTTAGTGSEVTFTAVFIRKDEKKKGGINSPFLYPDIAILDPVLTISLPPDITASTGLDALCHAIESYISRKANFLTECVSIGAIKLILENLSIVYSDGENLKARSNMLYGSFLAGVGLANAGVTAIHSISYPLGGRFGVPHGIGNALLLPYVLEFDMPQITEKLSKVAEEIYPEWQDITKEEKAKKLIEKIKECLENFKIPKLKELNIPPEDFPSLAEDAMKVSVPIENNPKPIKVEDIIEIYKKAY